MKTAFSRCGAGRDFTVAGFDLETDGLGGPLLCATYRASSDTESGFLSGPAIIERLISYMCAHSDDIWFAHFAQYDWSYFLDFFAAHSSQVKFSLRNDNTIFQIVYEFEPGRSLRMRDSYAIWDQNLSSLASAFCPELPKLDLDFSKTRFNLSDPSHIAYAKRDVEVICSGVPRLKEELRSLYGVNLAATLASTGMRAWEHMLSPGQFYKNDEAVESFVRGGYYGGLVFLTSNAKHRDCFTYDINSSYPYQMRKHGVPLGSGVATSVFLPEYPGWYRVSVRSPPAPFIPILPTRNKNGAVLWPEGQFETTVSSIELEFALSHGYELLSVSEGIVFPNGLCHPFTSFVDKAEEIRAGYRGKPQELIAKKIQNSLYGKFGARRERRCLISSSEMEAEPSGCEPWDANGHWYVRVERCEDIRVLPQWSAWITARARLHLLGMVYKVGPSHVLYGDTDSLTLDAPLITPGSSYGDFKLEKTWQHFRALAPKMYAGQLASGEWAGACKGLPHGKTDFQSLFEHGHTTATYETVPSLIVNLRHGAISGRTATRRSTNLENSLNWRMMPGDIITPRAMEH